VRFDQLAPELPDASSAYRRSLALTADPSDGTLPGPDAISRRDAAPVGAQPEAEPVA